MTANEAMARAMGIIGAMKYGQITYDEAKKKCEPYFEIANKKIEEVAKRFGKPAFKVSFTKLAR